MTRLCFRRNLYDKRVKKVDEAQTERNTMKFMKIMKKEIKRKTEKDLGYFFAI